LLLKIIFYTKKSSENILQTFFAVENNIYTKKKFEKYFSNFLYLGKNRILGNK
jgi:hypothetical protein